jgi:hypothetical protein
MTNEKILPPVAPRSLDSDLLSLGPYRELVEAALFDVLGRPAFFDQAVELVLQRIGLRPEASGLRISVVAIRRLIRAEASRLRREIEEEFMAAGKLGLLPDRKGQPRKGDW